jgi:probable HAF family extracellular repeat protein
MKLKPSISVLPYPFKLALSTAAVLTLFNGASTAWAQNSVSGPMDLGTIGGDYSTVLAISANGTVIVGTSHNATGEDHAASWTNGASQDLGTLGGSSSSANAVSADGRVIVGYADNATGVRAVSWTNGIMQGLDTRGGEFSYAHAVSADGKVIVGEADDVARNLHAVSWTNGATTPTDLGTLGGMTSAATGVSANGLVIIGNSKTATGNTHAASWVNGATTPTDLGTLGGNISLPAAVSADGMVIVGSSELAATTDMHAVSWTNGATTPTDLGTLGGTFSTANAVSADGKIIVGRSYTAAGDGHAVSWTNGATTPTDLGTLGGSLSDAVAISSDGKVIVGHAFTNGSDVHAAAWIDGASTATDLGTLGGTQSAAYVVSADGSVIAGQIITASTELHAALWKLSRNSYVGIDVNNTLTAVAQTAHQTYSIMEMQRLALGRLQNFCASGNAGQTCYSLSADGIGFGTQKDLMTRATMAHAFTDQFSLGASVAYSLWRNLPGYFQHNSNNYGAGVFAQWKDRSVDNSWYLRASLAANQYDIDRSRGVLAGTEAGSGNSNIKGWSGALELGKSLTLASKNVLGYYAGLRYTDLKAKGYTEQQVNFPFTYSAIKYNMSTAYLGASYTQALSSKLKWSVNAELEHDYRHQDPTVTASAQYVGKLQINSDILHTRLSASTTLSYLLTNGLALSVTPYVVQTATRDTAVGAMLALSGKF